LRIQEPQAHSLSVCEEFKELGVAERVDENPIQKWQIDTILKGHDVTNPCPYTSQVPSPNKEN
jgi:hypothetical protein